MTLKQHRIQKRPILIGLSITLTTILSVSLAFNSIVDAFVPCDPPNCYKTSLNGKEYKLTGDSAIAYGDLISRQIDYVALKEQLPFVSAADRIAIVIEGPTAEVESFVSTYRVDTMKSKVSTDSSFTSVFGYIAQADLEKYYAANPMNKFITTGLSIGSLGGYSDETGNHGPFGINLTEQQQSAVGKATSNYETQEMSKIINKGIGVEELTK